MSNLTREELIERLERNTKYLVVVCISWFSFPIFLLFVALHMIREGAIFVVLFQIVSVLVYFFVDVKTIDEST